MNSLAASVLIYQQFGGKYTSVFGNSHDLPVFSSVTCLYFTYKKRTFLQCRKILSHIVGKNSVKTVSGPWYSIELKILDTFGRGCYRKMGYHNRMGNL